MQSLRRLLLFGSLSILFLASCKEEKKGPAAGGGAPGGGGQRNRGPLSVDAFVVKQSSVSEDVQVPGSLLPFEETQIRSEVGGRIVELNLNEGALVQKGTLLVKLFSGDLQAQLKKLQVQLQIAEKTEERNRELLRINGISQQDYELSQLSVENLKADIESIQIAIAKTVIRAPYTGKLGLKNVSLGAYISPTDIITNIRQVDKLKLEFAVPEKYAREITPGYTVSFRVDGGTKDHQAKVMATESSVDQNTRTLLVRAVVDGSNKELVPGIFAKINLQLGKDTEALLVPSQAIIPTARNKQVLLLRKDSVMFTEVQTGIRDSAFVQVLTGLQAGDTVITTGLMAIRPKAKVRVAKVTSL
jgi:membrane fusion protein, multidrug efflux system